MTKCPKCAADNAETQRFCGDCGTPLPFDIRRPMSFAGADETIPLPSTDLVPGVLFARRYQSIEELGAGGMGRVYRVLDTKLDEEIALKVIRPDIASDRAVIARFSAELKLARQVVHRNVARMFDLNEEGGVPYITMEYVRGENLKRLIRKVGHLAPAQAVPIACQICDGLAEAHRLGIAHRDLKPQNVMIDEEGVAKIMDFGLARLLDQEGRDGAGSHSGTPAYVSPEQIRSESADGRADLYSLGIVLYEMLTGRTPFKGDTVEAITDGHLYEIPEDPRRIEPAIPAEVSEIVLKCLEKDPAARYQTAEEMGQALRCLRRPAAGKIIANWIRGHKPASIAAGSALAALIGYGALALFGSIMAPAPLPAKSTLAVLRAPDLPMGGAGPLAQFQDSLSVKLGTVQDLVIVPPLTVNAIDTAGKDPRRIGRLLKADYLLEPRCRVEGERIVFSASLINTRRNQPVRGYELSRSRDDPAAVEEEFARGVATVVRFDIAEDRVLRSGKGVSSNLDARLLVHEGMILVEDRYLDKRDPADFAAAVEKYKQALALDPEYALALYSLGNAYEIRYNNTPQAFKDPKDVDLMCEYYSQAYAKNWNSPETNVGLGWASFNRGDFPKAFEFFKKALKLEPEMGVIDQGVGAFLRSVGLYRQAIPYLARASKLAPQDPEPLLQIAQCYMALGRFDEAAGRSALAVARDPNSIVARQLHAIHLILARRLDEGEKEFAAIRRIEPAFPYNSFMEGLLAAARGDKDRALALRGRTESLSMPGTCFYIFLGMTDEAVANIEAGIAGSFEKSGEYIYSYPSLVGNPAFKSLRGLPRYQAILRMQKERYKRDLEPYEDM
ncbi:MAG: Serine/threonine-protein kinase PknB [Candidatus Aminicenantes bacterium]|nr:Serine/threonine-protein kinase PknB [Candidatus Aminicenantes bacterium]